MQELLIIEFSMFEKNWHPLFLPCDDVMVIDKLKNCEAQFSSLLC